MKDCDTRDFSRLETIPILAAPTAGRVARTGNLLPKFLPAHEQATIVVAPRIFRIWLFSCLAALACFGRNLCGAGTLEILHDGVGNQLSQSQAIAAPPAILTQPRDAILQPGGSIRFCVVASGTGAISYQWRHNGVDLPGATGDVLVLSGLAPNLPDYGAYSVVVSNGPGSVTSETVTVLPDSDGDNLPDPWETQHFGNLSQAMAGDFDNDKISNYDEWLNGSNPSLAELYLWPAERRWYQFEMGPPSTETITIRIGLPFPTRRIFAAGNATYSADGLPAGVSIDPITGVVSGTPTVTGQYVVNLRAITEFGEADGVLTVQIPPVIAWGGNGEGQANVPVGLADVVAVAGNLLSSFALRANGTVVGWGKSDNGQLNIPPSLNDAVALAVGSASSHTLALRANGTVVAWGLNNAGQATVPAGLGHVVAVAGGSGHSLALKADGTVVGWGSNTFGQSAVPPGLRHVVAIAAGGEYSLALTADGKVVGWGRNQAGQITIPAGLANVVAIAGGNSHSLALKEDGTVTAWGSNSIGQTAIPAGLANVVAIAAGSTHNLALKADGTLVGWGSNGGQIPAGLSHLTEVTAGSVHALALSGYGSSGVPEMMVPRRATCVAGPPVHLRMRAKNGPATFSANGLPAGLGIDPVTGVISGVAEQTGTFDVTVSATNGAGTGQGTMTLTVNPPDTQEIVVESPSETFLRNGLDTVALGAAPPGGTLDKSFSIGNIGAAPLAGLSVTVDGPDAADFHVHAQPAESVPAGGDTTFILRFQPGALGVRNATVQIVSNDADENPFNIAVTATARLTFADWKAVKFTPAELNDPAISGPTADAESDGLLNEMEYVLGLDPKAADGQQWQVATEGSSPSQYLTIAFSVPEVFAEDATLVVEENTSLGPASNWTELATKSGSAAWVASNGGVVNPGAPTGGRVSVTVRSASPIGGANVRDFMRLRSMVP